MLLEVCVMIYVKCNYDFYPWNVYGFSIVIQPTLLVAVPSQGYRLLIRADLIIDLHRLTYWMNALIAVADTPRGHIQSICHPISA